MQVVMGRLNWLPVVALQPRVPFRGLLSKPFSGCPQRVEWTDDRRSETGGSVLIGTLTRHSPLGTEDSGRDSNLVPPGYEPRACLDTNPRLDQNVTCSKEF
jgi:hypothetical protein